MAKARKVMITAEVSQEVYDALSELAEGGNMADALANAILTTRYLKLQERKAGRLLLQDEAGLSEIHLK